MQKPVLFLLFLPLLMTVAWAEEGKTPETSILNYSFNYTEGSVFDSVGNPEAGSLSHTAGLNIPVAGRPGKTVFLIPLAVNWYEGSSTSPESPELSISHVAAGIRMVHFTGAGKNISLQISGATGLNNGTASDFYFRGNLLTALPRSSSLIFVLGIAYAPELLVFPVPVAGMRWNPPGPWSLNFVLPQRVSMSYKLTESMMITAGLSYHGVFFKPGENQSYRVRGLDVHSGLDWRVSRAISLGTDFGVSILREEEIRLTDGSEISSKLSPAPFVSITLKVFMKRK